MRTGSIILCGGKSSRMGRDKATLPFGPELMLQRVVRIIGEVIPPERTIVVAGPNQAMPPLADGIQIARDADEFRGPLAGLATGLRALVGSTQLDAFYATSCDVPLLQPEFVRRMFDLLGEYDAVAPVDGENYHSLAAVYRPTVLQQIDELLAADRLRPRFLFDHIHAREVPIEALRDVDPPLYSLANLNHKEDYLAALAAAGFAPAADW
jgi:molybdenum cofactor guanylyltransferase